MLILVLVPKLHCDFVGRERKQLLAKLVIVLLLPFLYEEANDFIGPLDELVPVSPGGVCRVDFCDGFWVSDGS